MSARSLRRNRDRVLAAERRREGRRARRATIVAGTALGATVLFAPSAQAAGPFVVDSGADPSAANGDGCAAGPDDCTLRDAIDLANNDAAADTITFDPSLSGTTIQLTQGQILISEPAAINAGTQNITVLAAPNDRIFQVSATDPVSITGLTLSDGNVDGSGGAITTGEDADLTLTNCTVSGNAATFAGGGIFVGKYSAAKIVGSTITGNTAGDSGGGIYSDKYVAMDIEDSTISGNSAGQDGGGIHFGEFPETAQSGAVPGGSAVPNVEPGLTVSNTTISGNDADNGGGIEVPNLGVDDFVNISQSTISGNVATESSDIERSAASGVQAAPGNASFGGGINFRGLMAGPVEVSDSTISGNSAGSGGGISFDQGYYEPTSLRGRDANADALTGNGSVLIGNSTVAANTAIYQGGGIYLGSYQGPSQPIDQVQQDNPPISITVPLVSTIVADNNGGATPNNKTDVAGSPNDLDRDDSSTDGGFKLTNSLIEAPSADAALTQDPAGASIVGTDPKLGGLADNGGPTQTHLPGITSPALDVGLVNGLSEDQRGKKRKDDQTDIANGPGDGTDIGAVEVEAVIADQPFDKVPAGCPILPAAAGKAFAGGDNAETINGTAGNDILRGFGGDDTVNGASGDDCLTGDNDEDIVNGNDGDDRGTGGAADDTMNGGAGDDRFGGNAGKDVIQLAGGDDKGIGGPDKDRVIGAGGNDLVRGRAGDDKVSGDAGKDDVKGGDDDDKVLGGAGNDKLHGGFGDDVVIGGSGKDKIDCGKGHDTAIVSGNDDTVSRDCEIVKVQ